MDYLVYSLSLLVIYVGLAQLLYLQFGLLGIPNFGIVGFWGGGLYLTGVLTVKAGLPLVVAILLSTAAVGALALVVGWLLLRQPGQAILCGTLAFASAVGVLIVSEKWLTNGVQGLGTIAYPFASLDAAELLYGIGVTIVVGALVLASIRLRESRFGRVLIAIKDNEELAASLGKDTVRLRIGVFAATCALMGLLGGLSAPLKQFLVPYLLSPSVTITVWIALVLGGKGHVFGGIVGALLTVGLFDIVIETYLPLPPEHVAVVANLKMLGYGLLLIAVIMFRPAGILGVSGPRARPAAAPKSIVGAVS